MHADRLKMPLNVHELVETPLVPWHASLFAKTVSNNGNL
jgi:hypothetical protein